MTEVTSKEEQLYKQIALLQKRVFGQGWPRDLNTAIATYVQYIHVEATEALQETNFKHHKEIKPINMSALQEEIADLWIYIHAMAGVTFESYEAFLSVIEAKVKKNEIRKDWDINNE